MFILRFIANTFLFVLSLIINLFGATPGGGVSSEEVSKVLPFAIVILTMIFGPILLYLWVSGGLDQPVGGVVEGVKNANT